MKIIGLDLKIPKDMDCIFFMLSNSLFFIIVHILYKKHMLANIEPISLIASFFIASLLSIYGLTIQKHGLKSIGVILGVVFAMLFILEPFLSN